MKMTQGYSYEVWSVNEDGKPTHRIISASTLHSAKRLAAEYYDDYVIIDTRKAIAVDTVRRSTG